MRKNQKKPIQCKDSEMILTEEKQYVTRSEFQEFQKFVSINFAKIHGSIQKLRQQFLREKDTNQIKINYLEKDINRLQNYYKKNQKQLQKIKQKNTKFSTNTEKNIECLQIEIKKNHQAISREVQKQFLLIWDRLKGINTHIETKNDPINTQLIQIREKYYKIMEQMNQYKQTVNLKIEEAGKNLANSLEDKIKIIIDERFKKVEENIQLLKIQAQNLLKSIQKLEKGTSQQNQKMNYFLTKKQFEPFQIKIINSAYSLSHLLSLPQNQLTIKTENLNVPLPPKFKQLINQSSLWAQSLLKLNQQMKLNTLNICFELNIKSYKDQLTIFEQLAGVNRLIKNCIKKDQLIPYIYAIIYSHSIIDLKQTSIKIDKSHIQNIIKQIQKEKKQQTKHIFFGKSPQLLKNFLQFFLIQVSNQVLQYAFKYMIQVYMNKYNDIEKEFILPTVIYVVLKKFGDRQQSMDFKFNICSIMCYSKDKQLTKESKLDQFAKILVNEND